MITKLIIFEGQVYLDNIYLPTKLMGLVIIKIDIVPDFPFFITTSLILTRKNWYFFPFRSICDHTSSAHENKRPIYNLPRNEFEGEGRFTNFKIVQYHPSCYRCFVCGMSKESPKSYHSPPLHSICNHT